MPSRLLPASLRPRAGAGRPGASQAPACQIDTGSKIRAGRVAKKLREPGSVRHDGALSAEAPQAIARSSPSYTANPDLLPPSLRTPEHTPGATRGSSAGLGVLVSPLRTLPTPAAGPAARGARGFSRHMLASADSRFTQVPGRLAAGRCRRDPRATWVQPSLHVPTCGKLHVPPHSRPRAAGPRAHLGVRIDSSLALDDHPRPWGSHPYRAWGSPWGDHSPLHAPTGERPPRSPLHLPWQAESGRLVSWQVHRPIGSGATLSVGRQPRKQCGLTGYRCAREPRRWCGDSIARPAVPPRWTGSPMGRRCRSGPTGTRGGRPSRHGATPVRRFPGVDTRNDAAGPGRTCGTGWCRGPPGLVWPFVRIVRPSMSRRMTSAPG